MIRLAHEIRLAEDDSGLDPRIEQSRQQPEVLRARWTDAIDDDDAEVAARQVSGPAAIISPGCVSRIGRTFHDASGRYVVTVQ
jgi:hypothetical protein